LTDFHLWARALSPAQLHRARACAPLPEGLLFRWDPGALDVAPSLLPMVWVRLLCPETYHRLQDAQSWPGQDVISRVNALANNIVLLPDPLSEVHGALSPAEASSFLGLLEHVLVMEMAPLGPAALLAVVRFLKRVVALGAGDPELLLTGPWEQLGQGVVSVASLVLEEQVVCGPMALVESVQRLAPLLSTTMTSEQPRMRIQHRHAGLEVRSLRLREASMRGCLFTMPGGHPEGPGHIHIPASEVRRLLEKGLSGVTVIHSWFTSRVFQYTPEGPDLQPQAPASSKEANRVQRFLSTQVGSAIISSEVWDITGEVNMAVTFHLQHQAQPIYRGCLGHHRLLRGCPVPGLHRLLLQPQHQLCHPAANL
ncbi:ADGRD2 isoform 4, partial [Pongo abelii]